MTKIFTQAALQGRSLHELHALYEAEMQALVRSEDRSHARQQALANLEAISQAIAHCTLKGPSF